jgi:hypothetical protein
MSTPANASLPDNPPADKIVIDVVNTNGTGCPANVPGSATVVVSPDNTAFTVTYSSYLAQVGPGIPLSDFRKNCQLALNVHVPQGFTYAVAKADYRGFASLAKGATGVEKATYYFQGDSTSVGASHPFAGPMSDDWQTTDEADIAALVYKKCGVERFFNINTELRVLKGTSKASDTSMMFMDSTDGSITTIYHFHWKKCPPTP